MALTQEQVDWWFSQNPDATAEEVAEAVKTVGGLEANAGLADMIANRYAIDTDQVTDYYTQYTAPKTPVDTNTQTFTDTITSGTPTTQEELLSTLSAPADNITSTGGYTKSATAPTSGGVSNVVEGDDIDTQIAQLPEEYASWRPSSVPGYYDLVRKSDGAILDREIRSTFSDFDLLKMGLSFIPGMQPIVAGLNVADAARKGDWTTAAIGATGFIPGAQNLNTALKVGQAIDQNNPFGAITAAAGNTDLQKLIGLDTANVGGFTAKDVVAAGGLTKAAIDGNTAGVLTNLGALTNSPDVTIAGKAVSLYNRIQNGDTRALFDAVNLSNSISGNKTTETSTTLPTGTQIAGLDTGTVSDAGNGYTLTGTDGSLLTFPDFSTSDTINADADLFNNSIGDLDAVGTDTTTGGNITDTTGLDTGDVIPDGDDGVEELVVTGTGDKSTNTTVDTLDTTDTGVDDKGTTVITGKREGCPVGTILNRETGECDPYWDETGIECAPGFHDDGTGFCVADDDEQELVCDEGFTPNEAGTACIPVTTVTGKRDSCPVGTKLNPETGECDPDWDEGGGDVCDPGFHQDPETGMCVADEEEKPVVCEEGFHLGPDGKTCVADEEEKPVVCEEGFHLGPDGKTCVADEDDDKCADGFHRDEATGLCVPDDDEECKDGYEKVNGVCVPVCAEGYIRNLETGVCEKVEDKACPVGQVRNAEGKCVPIVVTPPPPPPPKTCPTGFRLVNGVCLPIPTIPTPATSALNAEGEKTDPIYAGAMDDFDLFATLEELLKENSDKTDKKKDSKKSKEKTKMATGGHLDDLLAEQMTVDDLLKLLR